jgi:hypothetical protein
MSFCTASEGQKKEMRYSRSPSGTFRQRLFFTTEEIDRLCLDALKKGNLLPNAPQAIRIDRFVETYFECPLEYKDFGTGILGCTQFNSKGSVVLVTVCETNDATVPGERRLRSTIAHEAGHGLMHASLFIDDGLQREMIGENVDLKNRRILCRQSDIGPAGVKVYDGRWWEWQANRAIGGLLLPKTLVSMSLDRLVTKSTGLGIATLPASARLAAVSQIAETFDVNPAVARIRLGEMYPENLTSQLVL